MRILASSYGRLYWYGQRVLNTSLSSTLLLRFPHIRQIANLYSPLFIRLCLQKRKQSASIKKAKAKKRLGGRTALAPRMVNTITHTIPPDSVAVDMAPVKPQEPWRENLNLQLICPECDERPPNLVEEFSSGDMVCASCGLVLGGRIVDTRSEWRTFTNDDQGNDDPSRVGDGANPLLNGAQLETSISFGGNNRSRELQKAQNKATHDKGTKSLLTAYKELGALCDAIGIPKNVSDTAKHLFKMVHDAGAFRGKSQETIIAGCIFIACRQCKVSRTFREIFALTKVSKAEIGRIFKALEKFFSQQNKDKQGDGQPMGGKFMSPLLLRNHFSSSAKPVFYEKAPSTRGRRSTPTRPQRTPKISVRDTVTSSVSAFRLRPLPSRSPRKWRMRECLQVALRCR